MFPHSHLQPFPSIFFVSPLSMKLPLAHMDHGQQQVGRWRRRWRRCRRSDATLWSLCVCRCRCCPPCRLCIARRHRMHPLHAHNLVLTVWRNFVQICSNFIQFFTGYWSEFCLIRWSTHSLETWEINYEARGLYDKI